MRNINWDEIQNYYNSGMSQRDIVKKFKLSSRTLVLAVRKGLLVCRDKSKAAKISHLKSPRIHTAEFKEKQRNRILKRYEDGWMPKAGRCKKIKYESPVAGLISVDGTWELAVAKYLDKLKYNWRRNTKRFQYINLQGKISHYTPDFYVEELGGYLEVKGYETELDRCKWTQFKEKLTIWKKDVIIKIIEQI
jgi:hypothetical protein